MQLEFLLAPIITLTMDIKDKCDRLGAVKIREKKHFSYQSVDINFLCWVYLRILQIVVLMYFYFTDIS